ncbi:MAG: PSD1 and planctomycete cytochrome C domain-containing protein [Gemmataceae bacterium]|nr:PSD1 and planctomycete cytochrome C domain-containing protein [Gemmataceae bacterium]
MHAPRMTRFRTALASLCALILFAPASAHGAAVNLPNGGKLDQVDFERHVMGLFGRMGCNMGSCHGSFQGKGGFRLSLFGYEPGKDYQAITREFLARRVSPVDPDNSLLLLKATGQVEHGGGVRFGKDSWQYRVFREWIVSGARWQDGSGAVKSIQIDPPECAFTKAGESKPIRVTATFTDGSSSDITPFCDFRTNDDAVAEVSNLGVIKALRPGGTAIVVSYRGNVLPVRVLVPMQLPAGFAYPKVPEVNYIDREVFARLRQLNMAPSDLASDAEFLRRVYIDTIGTLPTPDEVRAFLASNDPDKRAKKIDELLAHPGHAALWATKLCDITNNDTQALEVPVPLKPKRSQMWHDWFRKRVHENMPYDEIVRGVLTATSRDGKDVPDWLDVTRKIDEAMLKGHDFSDYANRASLDLFWRRQQQVPIELWGEKTAAAFMGVRLECAQCHKHPFDRWTQAEYRAYANIFGQVTFGIAPDAKKLVDAENAARRAKAPKMNNNQFAQVREVFLAPKIRTLRHPDTNGFLPARALGGPVIKVETGTDARVALFEWLRQPDHPFFARSFVNRIWGHYLGVGLVHPVDDFSLANPPSNEKLLDALAKDFIDHKFDIRHLERSILLSRTYQLSSKANSTNKLDRNNFARSYVRPMMAEVVVDVMNAALGVQEKFGPDVRPGSRAIEVGASQLPQSPALNYTFRIFGRPPRTAACDCERAAEPALPQKLYTMTDQALLNKIRAPEGRLVALLRADKTDDEVLDELFLATLTRLPREADRELFRQERARYRDRAAAFNAVLWALINTREFILNH